MTDEMLTPCTPHCFSKLSQTKLEQHNEPTASVKVRCFQLFWTLEIVSFFFHPHVRRHRPTFLLFFFCSVFFSSFRQSSRGIARNQHFVQPLPYEALLHQCHCCSMCIQCPLGKIHVWFQSWGTCSHVSGRFFEATGEKCTRYQDCFANYLKNLLQRITNALAVAFKRCYNDHASFEGYMKIWQSIGHVLEFTDEDVTTYQARLEGVLTKTLTRIKNVLETTWKKMNVTTHNVPRTCRVRNAGHGTLLHLSRNFSPPRTPQDQEHLGRCVTPYELRV